MDELTKVAIIGAGNMGIHHVRNYTYQQNVQIIGVVDRDELKLKLIEEKFGVKGFQDYKDIIREVDAVSIATPTSTHFNIAKEFLMAKKHVLIEKPMANEPNEAKKLIELSEQNHVILAVGHIERFNPVMQELNKVLKGRKPLFIDIHRESPFDPRIFDADVVSDLMIHDVDLLLYLLRERIFLRSAYGVSVHTSKNDIVNAQFVSESGVLINTTTSRATESKIRQWRLVLPNELIDVDLIERKLYITRRTSLALEIQENKTDVTYKQEQLIEKVLVGNYEPLQMEIQDFINAIRKGTSPRVGGKEGLEAMKIVKEIQVATANKIIDRQAI
ncbi:Gfo/Idh/MocA family protein [Paenibacillus sp. OAS669]|uniref:Gfo/Idh/MocA family protein n=1 Tax=Paenibacillus sp. OAS669 TaxID=2663821 RepID=UPI00178B1A40|nr:Gfo/Idh/MocA family oxidoreductase [Paenibacillus sp. OAS669]MBE1445670.1 putative dehydrogenase [Paenibacillus sp. OAS669]